MSETSGETPTYSPGLMVRETRVEYAETSVDNQFSLAGDEVMPSTSDTAKIWIRRSVRTRPPTANELNGMIREADKGIAEHAGFATEEQCEKHVNKKYRRSVWMGDLVTIAYFGGAAAWFQNSTVPNLVRYGVSAAFFIGGIGEAMGTRSGERREEEVAHANFRKEQYKRAALIKEDAEQALAQLSPEVTVEDYNTVQD